MYCGLMRVLFSMGIWVLRLTNYFSACVFDTWCFWYVMFFGGGTFHMQTITEHRRWYLIRGRGSWGHALGKKVLFPGGPVPSLLLTDVSSHFFHKPAWYSAAPTGASQPETEASETTDAKIKPFLLHLFLAAILLQRKRTNTATFCAWCFRWVCFSLFTQEETGSNYVSHLPRSELATRQNRHSN